MMEIKIKRLHPDAILPTYATDGAAGLDLYVYRAEWRPGRRMWIHTGIAMEIPSGYEGQIRPRSGLSLRGAHVVPGTIDSDYRGELIVLLDLGDQGTPPRLFERVAQLVIAPVVRAQLVEVGELSGTARGQGGFGSTGR